tara:strand:- start:305 stop:508 length:204 start_codon:yes stop_codon:yes gene_type:complete
MKIVENNLDEIIELALSDKISFKTIRDEYGLREKDVKKIMRKNLKPRSYKVWRKRVRDFSDRWPKYK